jgi:Zn finger protein HypA/HybF involved in hydrogenase expression
MHELSVIMAVVKTVDEYLDARGAQNEKEGAEENAAGGRPPETTPGVRVTRVTLQVGDRSSYLPSYIREIWPLAVNGTSLDGAALEIEDSEGADFFIKEIEIEE